MESVCMTQFEVSQCEMLWHDKNKYIFFLVLHIFESTLINTKIKFLLK